MKVAHPFDRFPVVDYSITTLSLGLRGACRSISMRDMPWTQRLLGERMFYFIPEII